jgi:hypothetical protein
MPAPPEPRNWLKRLGWLIFLWCASVIALGAVALGIRLFMRALGLHT